ncbi:globin domain-containing protein [Nocardioides sp.]|uniref:globin domain-containing protein n=1 Tax=Nocardioides sp. TaxID=35761 RepID=UPI002634274A|nr:globin domain-containing protein [Nocardioides sp.]
MNNGTPSARLSATAAPVIAATLPVVGAAIDEITPLFYRRLFTAHPELERDLFNRGNQALGTQQRALAASIAAYATLLLNEDGPEPIAVLSRIAHKHASLGVLAEHYPIVHEHLFAAIVDVLGEAVTPEVAAAWDEVYWHMANSLITLEKGLYAGAGVAPGQVWRDVVVSDRAQLTPSTVSFTLTAADGEPLPAGQPGQYISVGVRLPDGARQIRQYSLTDTTTSGAWTIAVKAIDEGQPGEVSTFLHTDVFEGDTVTASLPFGDATLIEGTTPVVLVSAGVGLTPMVSHLRHLRAAGSEREVLVIHADRGAQHHAHRSEVKELVAGLPGARLERFYEVLGTQPETSDVHLGRIDLRSVTLPADADVYLCGPAPFMASTISQLGARGVDATRIHLEVFGPGLEVVPA